MVIKLCNGWAVYRGVASPALERSEDRNTGHQTPDNRPRPVPGLSGSGCNEIFLRSPDTKYKVTVCIFEYRYLY